MTPEEDFSKVKVYFCACGKSIVKATHPPLLIGNNPDARRLRKEFRQAQQWQRTVATVTIDEFRQTPFGCDCKTQVKEAISNQ